MLHAVMLAFLLAPPGGWDYDDEVTTEDARSKPISIPAKAEPVPSPPPPVVAPILIPPIIPEKPEKPEPVERRPTATPEPPDASVQERIDQLKDQTPKESVQAPRRKLPVVRTCDRAAARMAARWRLADSTGKVWVAYDRAALVTHVQAVNAVLLAPEPIFVSPVVTSPIVELPPTTVVSSPIITTPVVSSTYTTLEAVPTTTFYSSPAFSAPLMSMPSYTGMGGGCAGGQCR